MARIREIASFFLWVSVAMPSHGMIFGRDDRFQVATLPGAVYAPIGIAFGARETKYATATLVDPCYVLTVQHIFGFKRSPLGQRLTFMAGVGSSSPAKSAGTVVASGGLDRIENGEKHLEGRARDWLLLKLDSCLGYQMGFARLVAAPSETDISAVQTAGFPVDHKRRFGLTVDPSCSIRLVRPLVWLHDCATQVGNSGGPIFKVSQRGKGSVIEIYAIESGGWPVKGVHNFRYDIANQATPAWQILPHIAQYVGKSPSPNRFSSLEN